MRIKQLFIFFAMRIVVTSINSINADRRRTNDRGQARQASNTYTIIYMCIYITQIWNIIRHPQAHPPRRTPIYWQTYMHVHTHSHHTPNHSRLLESDGTSTECFHVPSMTLYVSELIAPKHMQTSTATSDSAASSLVRCLEKSHSQSLRKCQECFDQHQPFQFLRWCVSSADVSIERLRLECIAFPCAFAAQHSTNSKILITPNWNHLDHHRTFWKCIWKEYAFAWWARCKLTRTTRKCRFLTLASWCHAKVDPDGKQRPRKITQSVQRQQEAHHNFILAGYHPLVMQ